MNGRDAKPREIFFEFVTVGRQVKVTAIDADTGVEVVVFGPVGTPQRSLEALAVKKLQWRLARAKE
ncbi:serine hydroxymethyltransferase [Stappia sp. F7233]|uniref:Serine hydroxymethyltransferase n=1 Tax=Stappia albiluteola TaxID=2758565 RepID=A0A839ACP2_9HYPH|nr:serine hydroxymethyltransferase [Stappia albiluteola]MBA5776875.1 serine hydroxymethyltransferase [Stappia albiluteola]